MKYRPITASVGKHHGKQCYNYGSDQETVQDLLNLIPAWQGGAEGSLRDPIKPGIVSPSLQYAIERFQRRTPGLSQDGHIDPGGAAIAKLNLLAGSAPPPRPGRILETGGYSVPTGLSEQFDNDPPAGPSRVIRLREIASGFLSVTRTFQGGPTVQCDFDSRSASAVTVNIEMRSATGSTTKTIVVPRFQHAGPVTLSTGGSPPINWTVKLSLAGTPAGAVGYTIGTDWVPGDPV